MWNLERNDMNELTYKRLTEKELTVARGKGELESLGWTCTHFYI